MPTRRLSSHAAPAARAVLLSLAAFAGVLTAAPSRQSGQSPAPAQTPTFRAAANFVQVDAYPTADGRPVADLTKDDFDVSEDGVAQSLATFEHISVRPGAPGERSDPTSTRHERDLVADIRNRLFVVFLDSYHVTDPTTSHARGADSTLRMPGSTVDPCRSTTCVCAAVSGVISASCPTARKRPSLIATACASGCRESMV
jgi:hypothetical protein